MPEPNADIEPQVQPAVLGEGAVKEQFRRKCLSNLRREMSDEELASPGVQKMLIDEIERLETEVERFRPFQDKFHDADKNLSSLKEKFRYKRSIEIIHIGCLAGGSILIGVSPSLWQFSYSGKFLLGVGFIFVIASLIAKWVKL